MVNDAAKDVVIHRRVLRNTVSNLLGKAIALITGFLLTLFILHKIGPIQYGLWILVGSAASYGSLLDLGITGAVIKYVAEYRAKGEHEQIRRFIATALSLYTVLGLTTIAFSAALA